MKKEFEIFRKSRHFMLEIIKDLSIEEINKVPEGFNNNIIWNLAHLVTAQQGVCYIRPGLTPKVEEKYIRLYKSETKPEEFVDADELEKIKNLFFSTIDDLETDYHADVFQAYVPWTTRYGVELATIDEAIRFLHFHEGIHFGYIMALKRVLKAGK